MEKWVSKVTSRLAKKKSFMEIQMYIIFDELVNAQKQFVEFAVHFVVKGEVIFYILIQSFRLLLVLQSLWEVLLSLELYF